MRGAFATGALGLALVLLGAGVDAEPLLAPGVALVALAAVTAGWVAAAARGASVARELSSHRVVEEEPLTVRLTARAGALPFPGGALEDPLLPEPAPVHSGRGVARVRIEVRFARRGARALAPPRLSLRDPLGVAGRVVAAEGEDRVLVLPRIHPVIATGEGSPLQSGGRAAPVAGAEVELDGLRPYRDGAPATRIHWPALARGAGLLERRLEADGEQLPLVVLDARGEAAREQLDAAVRAAASLMLALATSVTLWPSAGNDRFRTKGGASVALYERIGEQVRPVEHAVGARAAGVEDGARARRRRYPVFVVPALAAHTHAPSRRPLRAASCGFVGQFFYASCVEPAPDDSVRRPARVQKNEWRIRKIIFRRTLRRTIMRASPSFLPPTGGAC